MSSKVLLMVVTSTAAAYALSSGMATAQLPADPAAPPQASVGAGCLALQVGERCGAGGGRKTAGGSGTGKVGHQGWPPITGVLWKVTGAGHGSHTRVGTALNDELLGHHGSDTISGGAGSDVIWGDWDPEANGAKQRDVLRGGRGNDWLYTSHGDNTILGGPGADHVWAYYGRGVIDCGPGSDSLRIRSSVDNFKVHNCEHVTHF